MPDPTRDAIDAIANAGDRRTRPSLTSRVSSALRGSVRWLYPENKPAKPTTGLPRNLSTPTTGFCRWPPTEFRAVSIKISDRDAVDRAAAGELLVTSDCSRRGDRLVPATDTRILGSRLPRSCTACRG